MTATRARLALLGLVAGFVSVVAPVAPASATTVVPCTRTFAGPAKVIAAETTPDTAPVYTWSTSAITVPASSEVEDIDVTFDITHPAARNMLVRLVRLSGSTLTHSVEVQPRLTTDTGAEPRPLTFDDEATAAYTTASGTGTWRPRVPLSTFDGVAAGATWRLDVASWHDVAGRLGSWSVRISYTRCDADGDGAEDHVDNCRGVANPDQADLDRDGAGDACDGDPDGDGLPSAADSCPLVPNPDQADTDRDGAGDACDTDDDGDGRADTADGCPTAAAGTGTGCPAAATEVRVRLRKGRLVGRVSSPVAACASDLDLALMRAEPGRDSRLLVLSTRGSGAFRTRAPRLDGRYYVVAARRYVVGVAECGGGRSRAVRVR